MENESSVTGGDVVLSAGEAGKGIFHYCCWFVCFLNHTFCLHSPRCGTEQQLVLGGLVKVLDVALTVGSQI